MHAEDEIKRLQGFWKDEVEASAVYERLAEAVGEGEKRELLLQMRDTEARHAKRWETRIAELGGQLPAAPSGWKARWLGWLARLTGPERVFQRLEVVERSAAAEYGIGMGGSVSGQIAREVQADEKEHAATLRALGRGQREGVEAILGREKWHGTGGGAMREVIFGVNDGLVSTLSLVSGVAGAAVGRGVILLAGVAGLLSGAISMAAGAYISTKSQREVHEAQVAREREELEREPEEELEELYALYRLKGYSEEDARRSVDHLSQNQELMLESLVRDELGLMPETFPNPWLAGAQSGIAFVIGSFIPLIGYLFFGGSSALIASVGISVMALFVVGALKTLFTGLSWWRSGMEMVFIGVFATAVTYWIGSLFQV